jgi:hypothetical protein
MDTGTGTDTDTDTGTGTAVTTTAQRTYDVHKAYDVKPGLVSFSMTAVKIASASASASTKTIPDVKFDEDEDEDVPTMVVTTPAQPSLLLDEMEEVGSQVQQKDRREEQEPAN